MSIMQSSLQLEFNIENKCSEDLQISLMQKQIDQVCDSMGKVRRCLFSELNQMKKICFDLQKENEELKTVLKELKNEKTQWAYAKDGCLFDVQ